MNKTVTNFLQSINPKLNFFLIFLFYGWNHRFWCQIRIQRKNLPRKPSSMCHFSCISTPEHGFFCPDGVHLNPLGVQMNPQGSSLTPRGSNEPQGVQTNPWGVQNKNLVEFGHHDPTPFTGFIWTPEGTLSVILTIETVWFFSGFAVLLMLLCWLMFLWQGWKNGENVFETEGW